MPTVKAVVALLDGEVGYLEKKSNAQLDSKTANAGYNNFTKYTRDIDAAGINDARYQGQAWCCSMAIWPELHLAGKGGGAEAILLAAAVPVQGVQLRMAGRIFPECRCVVHGAAGG